LVIVGYGFTARGALCCDKRNYPQSGGVESQKKHLTYRQVLDICGGATGDRTPDLMTASDEKSSAGITPCLLLSTSQFTSHLRRSRFHPNAPIKMAILGFRGFAVILKLFKK
jgi:hypothetical protein